jgi:hypothetical protein
MRAHLSGVGDFRSKPIDSSIQLDAVEKANADRLGIDHDVVRRWKAKTIAKAEKTTAATTSTTTTGSKPANAYSFQELHAMFESDPERAHAIIAERQAARDAKAER